MLPGDLSVEEPLNTISITLAALFSHLAVVVEVQNNTANALKHTEGSHSTCSFMEGPSPVTQSLPVPLSWPAYQSPSRQA